MRSRALPAPRRSPSVPWWVWVLVGVVMVVLGGLLIAAPGTTATYLFWILGIACLVGGAVALISILFRRAAWGWRLLAGCLAIVVGLGLISQPLFSAYLLAAISLWVLGAVLLLAGMVLMVPAFSNMGWWYGVLGLVALGFGATLILVSVVGPLRAPWVFGIAAIAAGVLAIIAAFQVRERPQAGATAVSS
jgi:uncharacterized membrane protein HdeD (DUF308 family)